MAKAWLCGKIIKNVRSNLFFPSTAKSETAWLSPEAKNTNNRKKHQQPQQKATNKQNSETNKKYFLCVNMIEQPN